MELFHEVKGVKELKELRQMPYCLKYKKKGSITNRVGKQVPACLL